MLKSLMCATDGLMIAFFIFDALLILAMIGLCAWYFVKSSKAKQPKVDKKPKFDDNVEKINDDTYVIASDEVQLEPVEEPVQKDNAVEHFVNQISDINEQANNELNVNAVVVNHEVEQPVKKIPKKDEIQNYVMIGGVKKEKTEPEKLATHNRGTDAFKNSTNFLNLIKEEQIEFSNPDTRKAPAKAPAAKPAAKKTTATKTTAAKKTTK